MRYLKFFRATEYKRKQNDTKFKMPFREKCGSVVVYLTVIVTVLSGMFAVFIIEARNLAVEGSIQSLGRLWATSILGEYDIHLKADFDLLGYWSMPSDVESKINFFIDTYFRDKDYVNIGECSSDIYEYSLADIENFKKQIAFVGSISLLESLSGNSGIGEESSFDDSDLSTREIVNQRVIKMLPSYGRDDIDLLERAKKVFENMDSVETFLEEGAVGIGVSAYIDSHFRHALNSEAIEEGDDSFLKYEQEYILTGDMSDKENFESVQAKIIGIREAINIACIHADPELYDETLIAAELVTGGTAGPLAQEAIIASWALLESINDYLLLVNGKPVPFIKDKESWAVDIESMIQSQEMEYIYTGNENGNTYEDYIRALLLIMDEDVKVLRVMDLIQMNINYNYYDGFLLKECYSGVKYTIEVNGKAYEFEDEY